MLSNYPVYASIPVSDRAHGFEEVVTQLRARGVVYEDSEGNTLAIGSDGARGADAGGGEDAATPDRVTIDWNPGSALWERYERNLVPTIFGPLARDLVDAADLRPGERVLDVGTGTGVVARLAAEAVGPSGRVVGLDISQDFLAVAEAVAGDLPIEWLHGDAQDLPAPDASFDVVLSQQVLQFVADPVRALREARRVLVPGGRVLVSVATSLDEAPVYAALAGALEQHVGVEQAGLLRSMFAFSGLREALTTAGLQEIRVQPYRTVLRWPSAAAFVLRYLESTPFGAAVADAGTDTTDKIVDHVRSRVSDLVKDHALAFPLVTNLATGRAP